MRYRRRDCEEQKLICLHDDVSGPVMLGEDERQETDQPSESANGEGCTVYLSGV
jgi:hypothetical protein